MPVSNIESNPFCTRFVRPGQIAYQFADQDVGELGRIIDSLIASQLGAIVGPHGTGKSTLLQTLRPLLDERFHGVDDIQLQSPLNNTFANRIRQSRVNANKTATWQSSTDAELLIVDGIEQLSTWSRHRLLRQARRNCQAILATSHSELSGLETLFRTSTSPQIVRQLTKSLLVGQNLQLQSRIEQELASRSIESTTNVRELWFDMYDLCVTELRVTEPKITR